MNNKEILFNKAKEYLDTDSVVYVSEAIDIFKSLNDYQNSNELLQEAEKKVSTLVANKKEKLDDYISKTLKQEKSKNNVLKVIVTIILIGILAVCSYVIFDYVYNATVVQNNKYTNAIQLMDEGKYNEAILAFEALDGYKDSIIKIDECNLAIINVEYNNAKVLMDEGKYYEAISAFQALDGYENSAELLLECKYRYAFALKDDGKYEEAFNAFAELEDYKDIKGELVEIGNKLAQIAKKQNNQRGYLKYIALIKEYDEKAYSLYLKELPNYMNLITTTYDYSAMVKSDGTVITDATTWWPSESKNWKNITAISSSQHVLVGLKSDGTVVAIGNDDKTYQGQLNVGKWKNIIAISGDSYLTVGLKSNGTVVSTRSDVKEGKVGKWKNIVAISSDTSTVGLKKDGTVVAAGNNSFGECDVKNWKNIIAISTAYSHTVGLKKDGTVVVAGTDFKGQCEVEDWTDIIAISAGSFHTAGLKKDGTVIITGACCGYDWEKWTDIIAISAGDHTLGLKADGTIVGSCSKCNVLDWNAFE